MYVSIGHIRVLRLQRFLNKILFYYLKCPIQLYKHLLCIHKKSFEEWTKVIIINRTRCTNISIYFWDKTLHVSDSSSVHHQEFFTVHTAMTYVIQEPSWSYKSYCSTVHFRRITSINQPTNAHIISYKTHLKHFKTLRHVSILSDHHQGTLFLAKVILRYSQFSSYLQTSG